METKREEEKAYMEHFVKEEYSINEGTTSYIKEEPEDPPDTENNHNMIKFEIIEVESNAIKPKIQHKHICQICNKTFPKSYPLKVHMDIHNDTKYFCAHCNKTLNTKEKLKIHIKLNHIDKKSDPCKICKQTFKSNVRLRVHMRKVHNVRRAVHECSTCGTKCLSELTLQRHIRQVHEKNIVKVLFCSKCQRSFKVERYYKLHMAAHENEKPKKAIECSICFRTLANKRTLRRHMKSHTNEKPFSCKICNRSFRDKLYVKRHFESVHMTFTEESLNCFYCSKTFTKVGGLQSHMKRKHRGLPIKGDSTTCTIKACSEVCATLEDLVEHVKTHQVAKPFQCGTCQKTFQHKYLMLQHINLFHLKVNSDNEKRKFLCPFCPKRFVKKNHLDTHVPTHSSDRPYKCNMCSNAFKFLNALTLHKLIHSKPSKAEYVKCLYCKKGYYRKDYCARHIRTCHPGLPTELTGDLIKCLICMQSFEYLVDAQKHSETHKKPFECEYCHLKTTTIFLLEKHINKCHMEPVPSDDEEGTFECPSCSKKFTTNENLERHMVIHARPFVCAICSYAFSSKNLMKRHVLRHRKDQPYECSICHKKFNFVSELRSHAVTHGKSFECPICSLSFKHKKSLDRHILKHASEIPRKPTKNELPSFHVKQEAFTNYINDQEKLFRSKTEDGSSASTTFQSFETTFIKVEKGIVKEELEEYE